MTPEKILQHHCPVFEPLFSDPSVKAMGERILKAMEEYSSQQNADLKKELEEFKDLVKEMPRKYSIWCLGKRIPSEVSEIEGFFKRFLKETGSRLIPSTKEDTVTGIYPEFKKFSVYPPSQPTIATDHTTRKEEDSDIPHPHHAAKTIAQYSKIPDNSVKPDFEKMVKERVESILKRWNLGDYYLPLQKEKNQEIESLKQRIKELEGSVG